MTSLQGHYRGQQSLDHGWKWQQSYHHQVGGGTAYNTLGGTRREAVPISWDRSWNRSAVTSTGSVPPPLSSSSVDQSKLLSWNTSNAGAGYTTFPPTSAQVKLLNLRGGRYGYFMDRGRGIVTRLIPADMLPPLNGIAAQEARRPDMDVLSEATAAPPPGVADTNRCITIKEPTSTTITGPRNRKRPKIYCDKWVHEGVCAFTQQGCRYKHEMPLDHETQMSLGLFHGLPTWYKKDQLERDRRQQQQRQQQQHGHRHRTGSSGSSTATYGRTPGSSPRGGSVLEGYVPDTLTAPPPGHVRGRWRSDEGPQNSFRSDSVSARRSTTSSFNGSTSPFYHRLGPIGPPRKPMQ